MDTQLYAVVGLIGVNLILLIVLLWRSISKSSQEENLLIQKYLDEKLDRLERALRQEVTEASREARQELTQNLATFQQTQIQQLTLMQKSVGDTSSYNNCKKAITRNSTKCVEPWMKNCKLR
jgi:uncharacterized protein HemX